MEKIYVLLGEMTFLEEAHDGVFKAIIHRIDEIKSFDTQNEADEYAEYAICNTHESYLIPQVYNGAIEISED